ncbi:hypothetical protein ACFL4H_01930 [Candidatus Neomarinimicrobiota bacterium]
MAIAYFSAKIINTYLSSNLSDRTLSIILLIGTAILLTAGIGRLGYEIQTWGGTTPLENMNKLVFRILTHLGSYILFTDLFLKYLRK